MTRRQRYIDESAVAAGFVEHICAEGEHEWVNETPIRRHCGKCRVSERITDFPRDSVLEFARAMEAVLAENDHKGGWGQCHDSYLIQRMAEESQELVAVLKDISITDQERSFRMSKECVDVANFAMMIYDNIVNGRCAWMRRRGDGYVH